MRRIALVLVILTAALTAAPGHVVHGVSTTPIVGDWPFCTAGDQVGCIEYFSFENASGVMREYAALHESQNAGITVTASCRATAAASGAPCVPPKSMGCGSAGTAFQVSINPTPFDENGNPRTGSEFVDRKFVVRLRTGDFDPAFSTGGRIESTTRTKSDSGMFTFEASGRIQRWDSVSTNSVSMSPPDTYRSRLSDFLKTSKATSTSYGAVVSVFPAGFLQSTTVDLGGYCVTMPFTGAFADSNGMGLTTTWVPTKPTDAEASTIKFEVSGPHYLPESNGNDDKTVPARIRFFLPDAFFTAAGYSDPATFDASRMLVTTQDGQKPVLTLTRKTGGVLVDFGITHYSAPDPVVSLYRYGMTPTPTTTTIPTTTTLPAAAQSAATVVKGKSLTSTRLVASAGLSRPSGSKVTLKVSASTARYCRVVGTSVKALKSGTCRVTVTVVPKKGAAKSRTISVTVT